MALTRVTAGLKGRINQLNQIIDHLEGVDGSTLAWFLRAAADENFIVSLGDNAGDTSFIVKDVDGNNLLTLDSNGNFDVAGSINLDQLVVPQDVSPSQTTLGDLVLDSDGFFLTVGTGSTTKRLGLVVGAGAAPTITGEMAYDTTSRRLIVYDGTSAVPLTAVRKYAAATQQRSANTDFVDVVSAGTPATFTFTMAANEVWHARARLRILYTGTGGAKFQFTGPAAPTAVRINGTFNGLTLEGAADAASAFLQPFAEVTAFSSSFAAQNAGATIDLYQTSDNSGWIDIDLFVVNGANAGAVTLQFGQNSANGTTTLQIGSWLIAERVA